MIPLPNHDLLSPIVILWYLYFFQIKGVFQGNINKVFFCFVRIGHMSMVGNRHYGRNVPTTGRGVYHVRLNLIGSNMKGRWPKSRICGKVELEKVKLGKVEYDERSTSKRSKMVKGRLSMVTLIYRISTLWFLTFWYSTFQPLDLFWNSTLWLSTF